MKLCAYGDAAVLLTAISDAERAVLIAAFESNLPEGFGEYVIGHSSLLLVGQASAPRINSLQKEIDTLLNAETPKPGHSRIAEIEVCYNGADLKEVADATNLTVDQVIELHTAPTYTVRMMGFSPGFPYLDGLDPRLHLARRASPRNRIEPGSVAIGGPHAGIYSVASPGGWHILGQTQFELFHLEAAQNTDPLPQSVFSLSVGDRVRFRPIVE